MNSIRQVAWKFKHSLVPNYELGNPAFAVLRGAFDERAVVILRSLLVHISSPVQSIRSCPDGHGRLPTPELRLQREHFGTKTDFLQTVRFKINHLHPQKSDTCPKTLPEDVFGRDGKNQAQTPRERPGTPANACERLRTRKDFFGIFAKLPSADDHGHRRTPADTKSLLRRSSDDTVSAGNGTGI